VAGVGQGKAKENYDKEESGKPTGMAGRLTTSRVTERPSITLAGPGGLYCCPFQE